MASHVDNDHLHETNGYKCSLCDEVFDKKSKLTYHTIKEHEPGATFCEKCGFKALTRHHLNKHMKMIHHDYQISAKDRVKKCDKCDMTFYEPEEFRQHKKTFHENEPNEFELVPYKDRPERK